MQAMKQALNRTSASWQDFTRSQRGAASQEGARVKGAYPASSSDSDPMMSLSQSFTRGWRITASHQRKEGAPRHVKGRVKGQRGGLHPVESAPNLTTPSFQSRARRKQAFDKAKSDPVPDPQGARSAAKAARQGEFYDVKVRQSGAEAPDGVSPGLEATAEVLRRSPSLQSAIARVTLGRVAPERDGTSSASDSGSSVLHAQGRSVAEGSWTSSQSSPHSDQQPRLSHQYPGHPDAGAKSNGTDSGLSVKRTDSATEPSSGTGHAPAGPVPDNVSRLQPSGSVGVHSDGQGEPRPFDVSRSSRPKRSREAADGFAEEPSPRTPARARGVHLRRPSAVEMCQVAASGVADLQSVVAASHSLPPLEPDQESGLAPHRTL